MARLFIVKLQQFVMVRDALFQPFLGLRQFLIEQTNVLLPLAQDVGGARDVKKRLDIRKSLI